MWQNCVIKYVKFLANNCTIHTNCLIGNYNYTVYQPFTSILLNE